MAGPLIYGFVYDRVASGALTANSGGMASPAAGSVIGPVAYDGAGGLGVGYTSAAFVGTVLIEASVDSNTWFPIGQANLNISSSTKDEDWLAVPLGMALVRARVTAFTSGSLTLALEASGNPYGPQYEEYRPTYEAVLQAVAGGTTAFDQALFTPPAATAGVKVNAYIRELEVIMKGNTAVGYNRLAWNIESVAQTGGTLGTAIVAAVMDNIIDAAPNSTLKQYTTQPTGGGTVVATVRETSLLAPVIGTPAAGSPPAVDLKVFGGLHKALIIRPGNFLALNAPAAWGAGNIYTARVKWSERSW